MPAPFASFRYAIYVHQSTGLLNPLGGFAEATGLAQQRVVEYRAGSAFAGNLGGAVRIDKVGGLHKIGDVTLKRGVIGTGDLFNWIAAARNSGPAAKQNATITLRNEQGQPIVSWKLSKATPVRYTGPPLGGKASGDLAIEELILSTENIEIVPPR